MRSTEKAEAGRLARSVSIPYRDLANRLSELPKKALVVLYSDSDQEALDAFKTLRKAGLKKVALVPGNYDGWVKGGGKIVTGDVTTKIQWKRKAGKNEVSKTVFLKAVSSEDPEVAILDVRTGKETAAGHVKNATTLPLGLVTANLKTIPKDKKIYIHGTKDARAKMAVWELKKHGYDVLFLKASINCEGTACE